MATDIPRIHNWWQQPSPNNDYIIMSNFMPFVPSDLSANAQPPENAVNEQTDRWTDRHTNNNIHKHPWMLSVSHLDTSACQIVGHFFQALCMQYTNPSPWMVGRTDECMKWQQYPSASMLAKGKSSGNICISNSMPFLPSDLSANVQKPENVVNRPIAGQTDGQTDGQKSGRGALLLGGIAMAHYDLCPVDSCVNLLSALDSRNGVMSMRTSPHLRALLINNNPCGQHFS